MSHLKEDNHGPEVWATIRGNKHSEVLMYRSLFGDKRPGEYMAPDWRSNASVRFTLSHGHPHGEISVDIKRVIDVSGGVNFEGYISGDYTHLTNGYYSSATAEGYISYSKLPCDETRQKLSKWMVLEGPSLDGLFDAALYRKSSERPYWKIQKKQGVLYLQKERSLVHQFLPSSIESMGDGINFRLEFRRPDDILVVFEYNTHTRRGTAIAYKLI